jgi:hypothetical protein
MKESPILFNQEMVTAYFAGHKTQTRRIAKNIVPSNITHFVDLSSQTYRDDKMQYHPIAELCPYGQAGDRLWGRETWRPAWWDADFEWMGIEYKAGGEWQTVDTDKLWPDDDRRESVWDSLSIECEKRGVAKNESGNFIWKDEQNPLNWRPSIFMPRAAARILPIIKSVRLEMLQSISEADAIAEGVGSISEYQQLWDKLNKNRGYPWESNPPVWVVEFAPNI